MNAIHRTPLRSGRASASTPEPLRWRQQPSTWQRVRRASAVPFAAAAAVFAAIVLISLSTVWLTPHTPSVADTGGDTTDIGGAPLQTPPKLDTSAAANDTQLNPDASETGTPIFVHVVGQVHKPGVYELAADARITDAIDAAGGATDAAVLAAVNLARRLVDGEQVIVPDMAAASLPSVSTASDGAVGNDVPLTGLVNLNAADLAALETLPGVGPALARRIVEWRTHNGRFSSTEQLLDVSGIGPKTFEEIRPKVTV